jgi:Uma2 family endonuclease
VPEYWYVDLDADRVEVYRLSGGSYGTPELMGREATLESALILGFRLPVDELLGAPDTD